MKKLIIFDLDGTLLDTVPDLLRTLNTTLEKFNLKPLKSNEITSKLGYGAKKLVELAVGDIPPYEFEKVYDLYKAGEIETILKDWRDLSDTIGKYVNITQTGGKITQGYVVGINNEGSLIIERQDGTLEKIISGELRTVE